MRIFTFRTTIIGLIMLFVFGIFVLINSESSAVPQGNGSIFLPEPINILLLVSDQVSSNTDSIMVVNYKPKSSQISILSIPRDTKVLIDNKYCKINSAFWRGKTNGKIKDGVDQVVTCINQLINLKINYYAILNLNCVEKVVDELGGVDYNIPFDMKYTALSQNLHIDLKKGFQHLDGNKVIQLLRFRHPNGTLTRQILNKMKGYDGGDATRVDNNQKFLKEFFKQKMKPELFLNFSTISNVLKIIIENTETNLTLNDCLKYAKSAVSLTKGKINTYRLLGVDEKPQWFYVFNNTFMNNTTKKIVDSQNIINKYFGLVDVVESPTPTK